MFSKITRYVKKEAFRRRWKKGNIQNYTYAKNDFSNTMVEIGKCSYGGINVLNEIQERKLKIGCFCSIAEDVIFLLGDDHESSFLSTYPFKAKIFRSCEAEAKSKGDIVVDHDVWLGQRAMILSGVNIGQGAVVAAGAVVTSDVPPYAIVGGVPAKIIKYRFTQPVIDYLLTLDYSKLSEEMIREHVDDLYTELDNMELDEVKALFSWFPKKDFDK